MTADPLQAVARHVAAFLEPLARAGQSPTELSSLITAVGWDETALLPASLDKLSRAFGSCEAAAEALAGVFAEQELDLVAAGNAVLAATKAVQAVAEVVQSWQPTADLTTAAAGALLEDLLAYLFDHYLDSVAPLVSGLVDISGLRSATAVPAVVVGGRVLRPAATRSTYQLAGLEAWVRDPLAALNAAVGGAAAAHVIADVLGPTLARLINGMAVEASYGVRAPELIAGLTAAQRDQLGRTLVVSSGTYLLTPFNQVVPPDAETLTEASARLALALRNRPGGGLELVGVMSGALGYEHDSDDGQRRVSLDLDLGAAPFVISASGVRAAWDDAAPPLTVTARAGLRLTGSATAPVVDSGGASSALALSVRDVAAEVELVVTPQVAVVAHVDLTGVAFRMGGAGDDGLLRNLLPRDGAESGFDVGIDWSSRDGLTFRGGRGGTGAAGGDRLGVSVLPLAQFGPFELRDLTVRLVPGNGGMRAVLDADIAAALGPVVLRAERMGLGLGISSAAAGALGPIDLDVGFRPPRGVSLAIDSALVTGGGYLFADPANSQYVGAVQLKIGAIGVSAVGLLATRMPDGSPGFSLLVLMATRFDPPIALGYGFSLQGVGGLVGVNRTVAVDVLRAGLRAGTLGSILFPADPVRNAPQIVSDLAAVFPPAAGRFLFGPLAQLSWGTPTLLTMELGLILELPAPVRLAILGRLRVLLPDDEHPVVRLQLDALGVIDFESGDVALDAALYQSDLAGFPVTGQMALRANFGATPGFVLAVGGFHPRFTPPQGFPALERVAISLANREDARLRLQAYLALTTNTVQLGARLELYLKFDAFTLDGLAAFDTLVSFDPFGFAADLVATLALKYQGRPLLAVALELTVTGPTPWHAWGRASFELCFIHFTVQFEAAIGRAQAPQAPGSVRIRDLLLAALRDAANWATQLPASEQALVTLRAQPAAAGPLLHPLADLQVSQRVVPLGVVVTRFGNTLSAGERRFTLGMVGVDEVDAVTDFFAPAQFLDMTDDAKLTAPAFERLPAGIRVAARGFACGTPVVEPEIQYETKTVYGAAIPSGPTTSAPPYAASAALVEQVAPIGAAGLAPRRRTGSARYRTGAAAVSFTLKEPAYAVTARRDAAAGSSRVSLFGATAGGVGATGEGQALSYMAAIQILRERLAARPEERGQMRVVPYLEGVPA